MESLFPVTVVVAALLCGLVSGFLVGFASVVMPGAGSLDDRAFLAAFQAMDGVIQNRQPLFMLLWVGSVVALAGALVLALLQPDSGTKGLVALAAACYLLGVQLPTAVVNIPLNNRVQRHDLAAMNDAEAALARTAFEAPWNRWNGIRSALAVISTAVLLVVLLRL